MGVGFATMERRILDSTTGKMVNANLHDYRIPTAKDVPAEVTVLPIDPHDTECSLTGAKGVGEPSTIPDRSRNRQRFLPRHRHTDYRGAHHGGANSDSTGGTQSERMSHASQILISAHIID